MKKALLILLSALLLVPCISSVAGAKSLICGNETPARMELVNDGSLLDEGFEAPELPAGWSACDNDEDGFGWLPYYHGVKAVYSRYKMLPWPGASYYTEEWLYNDNDLFFVGDELWISKREANPPENGSSGRKDIKRTKLIDGVWTQFDWRLKTDFGHLNSVDYCPENDCLVFGNGGSDPDFSQTSGNWFAVIKDPKSMWDSYDYQSFVMLADVGIKYYWEDGETKINAIWGDPNGGRNDIVYVHSVVWDRYSIITKVQLAADEEGNFLYEEVTENGITEKRGIYTVLEKKTDAPYVGVGGMDHSEGTLYIGNGMRHGLAMMSMEDYNTQFVDENIYYLPGASSQGGAITGSTQGVAVDSDSIWVFYNNSGVSTGECCLVQYDRAYFDSRISAGEPTNNGHDIYISRGDTGDWTDSYAYEGDYAAVSRSFMKEEALSSDNLLITAALDIPEGGCFLSFYAKSANSDRPDELQVLITEISTGTDELLPIDDSAWTVLMPSSPLSADYKQYCFDISDHAGDAVRVAFRHLSSDEFALCIDKVQVGKAVQFIYALDDYEPHDYNALLAFFEQTDSDGIKVGEKLFEEYDPLDPSTWSGIEWTFVNGRLRAETVLLPGRPGIITGETVLDLSECASLERLCCDDLRICRLCVNDCPCLRELSCSGNELTELDLSGCPCMVSVSAASGNALKAVRLDPSALPAPKLISVHGNGTIGCSIAPDRCELFARPDNGESFIGWYDPSKELITKEAHTVFVDPEETALFAVFTGAPFLVGDVNGDGVIDSNDALQVLRHVIGLIVLSPEAQTVADTTGDGEITASDALVILRIVLNYRSQLV